VTRYGADLAAVQVTGEANLTGIPAADDGAYPGATEALIHGIVTAAAAKQQRALDVPVGFTVVPERDPAAGTFWPAVAALGGARLRACADYVGIDMYPDVFGGLRAVHVRRHEFNVTTGPDQALWLTLIHSGQVARLSPGGDLDSYQAGPSSGRPSIITTGPDGALWFTLNQADAIGRITTSGDVSAFPVTAGSGPFGLTHGPDGALWYTQIGADRIGRITTTGQVTDFPLPATGSMPSMITLGADEALWFAEIGAGQVGRITAAGQITEYPLPDRSARPHAIIADPSDGGCWFTEWAANRHHDPGPAGTARGHPRLGPGTAGRPAAHRTGE
jgi:virginiamycin B lyase